MIFRKEEVLGSYSRGLENFIGSEVSITDDMKRIINGVDLSELSVTADFTDISYLITRDLIEGMSTENCRFSKAMRDGLAEAVSQRMLEHNLPGFTSGRNLSTPQLVQYKISDILVDAIGSDVAPACILKAPDLTGELLHSIPYKGTTLMSYLNDRMDVAIAQSRGISSRNLGRSSAVVDCCEAICDCREKLQVPKESLNRSRGKTKEKRSEGIDHEECL